MLFDIAGNAGKQRFTSDIVLVGRGRTEINLATTAPYASRQAVLGAEVRLARILINRASA